MEEHRPDAPRGTQRIDRAEEQVRKFGFLQPVEMRDPLVRFAGETESVRRCCRPIFERRGFRQLAECVIDFDRVQSRRVVLEEILGGQLLRIEIGFPGWVRES